MVSTYSGIWGNPKMFYILCTQQHTTIVCEKLNRMRTLYQREDFAQHTLISSISGYNLTLAQQISDLDIPFILFISNHLSLIFFGFYLSGNKCTAYYAVQEPIEDSLKQLAQRLLTPKQIQYSQLCQLFKVINA